MQAIWIFLLSLALSPQGIFSCFLSSVDFFLIQLFSKNSFRNTLKVSNSLDPVQALCFVGPDLGPNCLQKLSADDMGSLVVYEALLEVWGNRGE